MIPLFNYMPKKDVFLPKMFTIIFVSLIFAIGWQSMYILYIWGVVSKQFLSYDMALLEGATIFFLSLFLGVTLNLILKFYKKSKGFFLTTLTILPIVWVIILPTVYYQYPQTITNLNICDVGLWVTPKENALLYFNGKAMFVGEKGAKKTSQILPIKQVKCVTFENGSRLINK